MADDVSAIKSVRSETDDVIAIVVQDNQLLSVNEAIVGCRVPDDPDLAPIERSVRARDCAGKAESANAICAGLHRRDLEGIARRGQEYRRNCLQPDDP